MVSYLQEWFNNRKRINYCNISDIRARVFSGYKTKELCVCSIKN